PAARGRRRTDPRGDVQLVRLRRRQRLPGRDGGGVNILGAIDADAPRRDVGRFAVSTDGNRVAAFRDSVALAGDVPAGVPPTFPLAWWMEPEVKGALVAAMAI